MHLSLRAGERIFINGAVLRVDRKVSIELLNDATFLLENHVLQVEDATTPLRQLYFVVQAILIDPSSSERARVMFRDLYASIAGSISSVEIAASLKGVADFVETGRTFDALKIIRGLFQAESNLLSGKAKIQPTQAA
jgi:flagellar biosynthesis repressor protein FlbT